MLSWLARYADEKLREKVAGLEHELGVAKATMAVQLAELQAMAGVIARDRERVRAETAGFARTRADAEGGKHV